MRFLNGIIDPQGHSFDQIEVWLDTQLDAIAKIDSSPQTIASFAPVELRENFESEFGAEASPRLAEIFYRHIARRLGVL